MEGYLRIAEIALSALFPGSGTALDSVLFSPQRRRRKGYYVISEKYKSLLKPCLIPLLLAFDLADVSLKARRIILYGRGPRRRTDGGRTIVLCWLMGTANAVDQIDLTRMSYAPELLVIVIGGGGVFLSLERVMK